MYETLMRFRYLLAELKFRLIARVDERSYLFPRSFIFNVTHIPTAEEWTENPNQTFIFADLSFKHGLGWRTTTLQVFKQASPFQPTWWRWAGSGETTPGFLVERLERTWACRRQALEARLTLTGRAGS